MPTLVVSLRLATSQSPTLTWAIGIIHQRSISSVKTLLKSNFEAQHPMLRWSNLRQNIFAYRMRLNEIIWCRLVTSAILKKDGNYRTLNANHNQSRKHNYCRSDGKRVWFRDMQIDVSADNLKLWQLFKVLAIVRLQPFNCILTTFGSSNRHVSFLQLWPISIELQHFDRQTTGKQSECSRL